MTEQDTANMITFGMALLLGFVAFLAGYFWGYDAAMKAYTNEQTDK